jgi:hypothetical protein
VAFIAILHGCREPQKGTALYCGESALSQSERIRGLLERSRITVAGVRFHQRLVRGRDQLAGPPKWSVFIHPCNARSDLDRRLGSGGAVPLHLTWRAPAE